MSKNETLAGDQREFLKRCLGGKKVGFHWKKEFTDMFLEIEIPCLSDNQFSTWGDWGPMYKFEMLPNQYVKIATKSNIKESTDAYDLEIATIELNSPALGELRKQYPLFFKLNDSRKELFYEIYLNTSGEPGRVKVYRQEDKIQLFETDKLTSN